MFNIIYSILPPNDREHIHRHSHTIALILRLCRDFYLIPILLVFINILLHPLPVLLRVKNAYTFKLKELENDEKDLFFVSAYYYEQGVYENQVSLVFVAPRDAQWERRKLIVIRSNEADSEMEVMKVVRATPHNLCKFVTLVGTAVLKNDIQNLKIVVNWKAVDIRYLPADNTQRDLVVCTPPIYHSVRWQNVLLAAHVYSKFGGHLQSYIYSVTPALFKLFEELKRLKGISVDAMPDFYGSKNLGEIEFGGVTVSNCDCLNKYKRSASYITFLEWDDLLVPKMDSSYFLEFAHVFESEIYIGILEFRTEKNNTKILTRPMFIDSVWLNEPVEKPYKLRTKQLTSNKVYPITESIGLEEMIKGNFSGSQGLRTEDLRMIEYDLKRTISDEKVAELLVLLQSEPTLSCSKSFVDFYSQKRQLKCPGPHLCSTPPSFKCVKSNASFQLLNFTTNFYQPENYTFSEAVCSH